MNATPPPTRDPNNTQHAGNIKDSIAALRSILMIDTPTKAMLAGQHPSVDLQRARHEEQKQQEEIAELRTKASDLKLQVQRVANEAAQENRMRKSLETTYEAMAKHKEELSVQLELVTKARQTVEEKLDATTATLQKERTAMAKERELWKPELERLQRSQKGLESRVDQLQRRCQTAETKAQQFESRVKILEKDLADTQNQLMTHKASLAGMQPRLDRSEKLRCQAEKDLQNAQAELATLKRRHGKSLDSLLKINQGIKADLKVAIAEKVVAEEKYQALQSDMAKAMASQKEAETQLETIRNKPVEGTVALENELNSLRGKLVESEATQKRLKNELEAMQESLEISEKAKRASDDTLLAFKQKLEEQATTEVVVDKNMQSTEDKVTTTIEGTATERQEEESIPSNMQTEEVPNSVQALEQFIRDAMEKEENGIDFSFLQRLASVTRSIKEDLKSANAGKKLAESKLLMTKAVDDKTSIELASAREQLRETMVELEDTRDELRVARQLNERDSEAVKRSAESETVDNACDDSEADNDDEKSSKPDSKRQKTGDHVILI